MSDVIKLLPDSVANQIAAGEVIQRPASVVKELVENAVDAGATSIKIILRDAGKTLIQVVDNGCGMSDTDARLAFERHATSKIRQAADLFELHTMGFRGEALPSIVAVAQVELATQRKGSPVGSRLKISGSKFESQTPEACAPGTNIMVKNLFFNFPARRKFLKKDTIELSHIIHEFERLALVNPHLEFSLVHNDVTLHQLLPSSLKARVASLFGKSLESQLIPVATETSLVKLTGLVSLPEHSRRRNALQYFFVNGRNMRHPYFHKAVTSCYEELISADQQPSYFINFEVDPQTIDVNIHPTKSEIKFENEQPIWQILSACVKEALGKYNAVPSIDFDQADSVEIPAYTPLGSLPLPGARTPESGATDYNPFASTSRPAAAASRAPSRINWGDDWESLRHGFEAEGQRPAASALNAPGEGPAELQWDDMAHGVPAESAMQINNRLILAPARGGLMVVDQYRAHVKVLFEANMATLGQLKERVADSQQLLFPETLTLTPVQQATLGAIRGQLEGLGFALAPTGQQAQWAVTALPASLGTRPASEALMGILDEVSEAGQPDASTEALRRSVALAGARSGAVRPGQALQPKQIEGLLSDLLSLPTPNYTPDGQPVFTILTTDELAKRL